MDTTTFSHSQRLALAGLATGILGGEATMKILADAIFLPRTARALDLGCHGGVFSLALADRLKVAVLGIDILPEAIALAQANASRTTTAATTDFRVEDALGFRDAAPFDLVVHRGLEAFVDPDDLARSCSSLLKEWGYLAVVTHLYRADPGKLRDELNARLSMRIPVETPAHLIQRYARAGLVLLKHTSFPAEILNKSAFDGVSDDQLRAQLTSDGDLIARNDALCDAHVFVFRKRSLNGGGFLVGSIKA